MALPSSIEIGPGGVAPVSAVTVPGSKSITNRALVLAALAQGTTILRGALWSDDTEVMVDALRRLGFELIVEADTAERCNRTIRVTGLGGIVPRAGTEQHPLELFVGNAGTAARFLAALVCLGQGVYRLHGVPRMHERPQASLLRALRELGYQVQAPGDKLPAIIHGAGPKSGTCSVDVVESSQFASALLLCARVAGWQVQVTGDNEDELPYVKMTETMVRSFPAGGGLFQIEPDASSGSYFIGANLALKAAQAGARVTVAHWPESSLQIDSRFPVVLERMERGELKAVSRATDLGDSIMTAIVLAPLLAHPTNFGELGRLRLQECERVKALRMELEKCGAHVVEEADTLTVFPSPLHPAEIDTYEDHRMAMCFAMLGLAVPGMRIRNPRCVRKTFPNFFEKVAAPCPSGLGSVIREGQTGEELAGDELLAF